MVLGKTEKLNEKQLKNSLRYIDKKWDELKRTNHSDIGTLIGLPYPYIIPSIRNGSFNFSEQYYWDSYFTALGMDEPKHQELVEGMLENLIFLYKRFGLIPNASQMYFLGRSQPPLLTSFIFLVYERYDKPLHWLEEKMKIAEAEYRTVWTHDGHPYWHNIHKGLSRYYDINVLHDLAEAESGWDMTTRFDRRCLDYLPVDLNALLFKYEMDFARVAEMSGDKDGSDEWRALADARARTMTELMWGRTRGFFFDYNYTRRKGGDVWSLAAYYTMWAGSATEAQAERLVKNLDRFEKKGGLTTTTRPLIDMSIFGSLKTQWAYPNGWAPLHYIVIEGLNRYGYHDKAKKIAEKWLTTNTRWFEKHGIFIEKYNVVAPNKRPTEGVYPAQEGFGWTNGIYAYLASNYL